MTVLGATAWVGGVLVLLVMALVPILEHVAQRDRRDDRPSPLPGRAA